MTNTEKMKIALEQINNMYPKKMILNGSETARILGISYRTFARIIEKNEIDKLPRFKSQKLTRANGLQNTKYTFNIFDVAEFLIKN